VARDFDDFYAASYHTLAIQLYAYLGDLHEAQDVVQEAYFRAYLRWGRIGGYNEPLVWVRTVAWNLATSRLRRIATAHRYWRTVREIHAGEPSPDRVAVVQALAKIPAPQRKAVVLHYMGGLSVAEIAAQEQVPEGTVKSWLSRGRSALGRHLAIEEETTEHARPL
jgi:RNA polymerase sigma-70 factor (ECF subfamily)